MNRRRFLTGGVAAAAAGWTVPGVGLTDAWARRSPTRSGPVVQLDAKPARISIDVAKTAVLVVDMTNDFGTKGGMFERSGRDISPIQKAVAPTARVLASSRAAGIKVVYLKMAFRPDLSDMGLRDSPNWRDHHRDGVGTVIRAPNGTESRVGIRDTWNTEIVDELKPERSDIVIYKNRFSGFYQTGLDATLKGLGTRFLIVTGCTTSVCVESTIRDAAFRDYSPVLLADCTAEPLGLDLPRSNYEASLLLVEAVLGWVSSSESFIGALQSSTSPA